MNNYTDTQLKQALAKMLPEHLEWHEWENPTHPDNPVKSESCCLCWSDINPVLDTELLHICWLVEGTLDKQIADTRSLYLDYLGCIVGWNNATNPADAQFEASYNSVRATWQQRTIALAKVKGVEIV